jgi:hypothetical protein
MVTKKVLTEKHIIAKLEDLSEKYMQLHQFRKDILANDIPPLNLVESYTEKVNALDIINNDFSEQLFNTYKVSSFEKRLRILNAHYHISKNKDTNLLTAKLIISRYFISKTTKQRFMNDRNKNDRAHIKFIKQTQKLSNDEINIVDTNIKKIYDKMIEIYNKLYYKKVLKPILNKLDTKIDNASKKNRLRYITIRDKLVETKSTKNHIPHKNTETIKAFNINSNTIEEVKTFNLNNK